MFVRRPGVRQNCREEEELRRCIVFNIYAIRHNDKEAVYRGADVISLNGLDCVRKFGNTVTTDCRFCWRREFIR